MRGSGATPGPKLSPHATVGNLNHIAGTTKNIRGAEGPLNGSGRLGMTAEGYLRARNLFLRFPRGHAHRGRLIRRLRMYTFSFRSSERMFTMKTPSWITLHRCFFPFAGTHSGAFHRTLPRRCCFFSPTRAPLLALPFSVPHDAFYETCRWKAFAFQKLKNRTAP